MYDRMIKDHGYSVRKLAQKLGKDKGYLENRLRLADAPEEIRDLVSVRKDTLSHAYELMKIADPRKRRRLAGQVARGGMLHQDDVAAAEPAVPATPPTGDDALLLAKAQFHDALESLIAVLRSQEFTSSASPVDRHNLAKYLTISKLTLENVITVVRGPGVRD